MTNYNITAIEKKGANLLLATSGEGILETEGNFRQWIKSLEFTGTEEATFITTLYPLDDDIMLKGSSNLGVIKGQEELNEGLEDLEIRSIIEHKGFLYVGTYRDGVLIYDIDDLPFNNQAKQLSISDQSSYQVGLSLMPNPAKDMITVSFSLEENGIPISLQIISEEGRLVKTIFTEELHDKGIYAKRIKLTSLPTGVYFVVMTTDKGRFSQQFLLKN